MKKQLYVLLAIVTCLVFMTGCSFFQKPEEPNTEDTAVSSDESEEATEATTEDEEVEIPVDSPEDGSSEESTEDKDGDNDASNQGGSSNPRDDVATDSSKEYTTTGKYCGFIDSTSVEIQLSDGSYCTFFVYDEEIRSTLFALNEDDMPEITFSYKAKEGQINPEMISVIGG